MTGTEMTRTDSIHHQTSSLSLWERARVRASHQAACRSSIETHTHSFNLEPDTAAESGGPTACRTSAPDGAAVNSQGDHLRRCPPLGRPQLKTPSPERAKVPQGFA